VIREEHRQPASQELAIPPPSAHARPAQNGPSFRARPGTNCAGGLARLGEAGNAARSRRSNIASAPQTVVVYAVPLWFRCLRRRTPGGEHLRGTGDRGEPRVLVRQRRLNKRPRAAAAMTISPAAVRRAAAAASDRPGARRSGCGAAGPGGRGSGRAGATWSAIRELEKEMLGSALRGCDSPRQLGRDTVEADYTPYIISVDQGKEYPAEKRFPANPAPVLMAPKTVQRWLASLY
jgi:hypothetical protein